MPDLCLPLTAGEDTFELHLVQLELEAVEKQIRDLVEEQAQLRERETSRADAHKSGVSIQRAANTPNHLYSVCFSAQAPCTQDAILPRCPSLRHRDTTDPGCAGSSREGTKPGPGRQPWPPPPPPVLRDLHHQNRFAPLRETNATLWSSETPSSGTSVLR